MPSASALRLQIETALAQRIPSALTPAPKVLRPVAPTGVAEVDALLEGGLPLGAITEMVGPESSGRTSLALSFVAGLTGRGSVAAWIDVSNTLDPESAAAAGVDLPRLLWVRCGVAAPAEPAPAYRFALPEQYLIPPAVKQGLHGGGCGGHPRNETRDLAASVTGFLRPEALAPRCAEPQRKPRAELKKFKAPEPLPIHPGRPRTLARKPWPRMEQALRATDLLLQAGGFSAVVLDMGSLAPEYAARVPLATWFRYRAAAERTQASVLLLTQHSCAKSSGELLLRFQPSRARSDESTVFTGSTYHLEVERRRFSQTPANVVPMRKPPQRVSAAEWRSRAGWVGPR